MFMLHIAGHYLSIFYRHPRRSSIVPLHSCFLNCSAWPYLVLHNYVVANHFEHLNKWFCLLVGWNSTEYCLESRSPCGRWLRSDSSWRWAFRSAQRHHRWSLVKNLSNYHVRTGGNFHSCLTRSKIVLNVFNFRSIILTQDLGCNASIPSGYLMCDLPWVLEGQRNSSVKVFIKWRAQLNCRSYGWFFFFS